MEMQIKVTVGYFNTPKQNGCNLKNNKQNGKRHFGKDVEKVEPLHNADENISGKALEENRMAVPRKVKHRISIKALWWFSIELNIHLPLNPTVLLKQ